MNNRPISLAALTVIELKPHEMVEVAYKANYQMVGLRLIPATPTEKHHSIIGNPTELLKTKKMLKDTGVKVLDIEILRLQEDTDINNYTAFFETGAELGASEILVAGNDNDENRLIDNMIALCEASKPYGLHPNLEFMPWTGVKDLKQASRILKAVSQDNAGLLIDPFHLNRSFSEISDIAVLPNHWFRYAQLCDISGEPPSDMSEIIREAREERQFPGDGEVNLKHLISVLPGDLPLSIEVPTEALRLKGVSALKRAKMAMNCTKQLLTA